MGEREGARIAFNGTGFTGWFFSGIFIGLSFKATEVRDCT